MELSIVNIEILKYRIRGLGNFLALVIASLLLVSCGLSTQEEGIREELIISTELVNEQMEEIVVWDSDLLLILSKTGDLYELELETNVISRLDDDFERGISWLYGNGSGNPCFEYDGSLYEIEGIDRLRNKPIISAVKPAEEIVKAVSLFETNEFKIFSACAGEFGGFAVFKSSTGEEYVTEAICLIKVDTLKGDYYLFNTLHHLGGFSRILRIEDIYSLPTINPQNAKEDWRAVSEKYNRLQTQSRDSIERWMLGDTERNRILFDSIGMIIIDGFVSEKGISFIGTTEYELQKIQMIDQKAIKSTNLIDTLNGRIGSVESNIFGDRKILWCKRWAQRDWDNYWYSIIILDAEYEVEKWIQLK